MSVIELDSILIERSMRSIEQQEAIRADIFEWLAARTSTGSPEISHIELKNYTYRGERIPLKDGQKGIWNPADFDSTLSITTSLSDQYEDEWGDDLSLLYSYQAKDGGDNTKVRRAMDRRAPLVYFKAIRRGMYLAFFPAYVVAANDVTRKFSVAFDESLPFLTDPTGMNEEQRRYAERTVRQRLHQPVFRANVMQASATRCAVCRLDQSDLLDAAHIIGDARAGGFARVSNGLAMCKLHHAAYDRNLLGISPDLIVSVSEVLLARQGGTMLRHGLQDMHGVRLHVPRSRNDRPAPDALAERFSEFAG